VRKKKDSALDADRDGSVSYHGPRRRAREEASDVIFIFAHAGRQAVEARHLKIKKTSVVGVRCMNVHRN